MKAIYLLLLPALLAAQTYRVGTLLFTPGHPSDSSDAESTIAANYQRVSDLVKGGSDVQLYLLPEAWNGIMPGYGDSFFETYPDLGAEVCKDLYKGDFQHYSMACLAIQQKAYVVANIPEILDCNNGGNPCNGLPRRKLRFNSIAVYTPAGVLFARYRQTQVNRDLFDSDNPDSPESPFLTTFSTSFGVKFGLLMGADAMHPFVAPGYQKDQVSHLLLPLSGLGGPPVFSAASLLQGISYNFQTTVIGAQGKSEYGVGIYEKSVPAVWKINEDPSDTTFGELIEFDLQKSPSSVPHSLIPAKIVQDPAQTSQNCTVYIQGAQVKAPCVRFDIDRRAGDQTFKNRLQAPVQDGTINCAIEATLSASSDQVYAMITGGRSGAGVGAFCVLAICHDFPDCSASCPSCTEPYIGKGSLSAFKLEAEVPAYFEGERQLHYPMMNSFEGAPISGQNYDWKLQNATRYMTLREAKTVPFLMSGGLLYAGLGPYVAPPSDSSSGLSPGAIAGIVIACIIVAVGVAVLVVCCVRRSRRRKDGAFGGAGTMHEEKRDSFIQT